MNLSKFFIDRPIFAGVLSLLVFLAGRTCLASFWSICWPRFQRALIAVQAALPREKRAEKRNWIDQT